ncbi:vWA domain-containing protein [Edaphobacter aggregans]|uniref:vWA domain-containing protein n=1 Tax=Edaphobacter aggregans TaxID=570835 RepID=UPI0006908E0C|nr:VWA-like domain-containing protein [Edaphobacter aggregans]
MTKHLPPAVRIQKARTALLLDHPFFGSLLFRLGERASGSIQTMTTDGISLFYNPAFVETLSAAELAGVLAHEVMHPALQHHTRRGDRDRERWNMACDYAINPLLRDAGLTLPKDALIERRFHGMSAERIYNLIDEQQDQDSSNGEGENPDGAAPGGEGEKQADNKSAGGEPTVPATPGGFGQVLDAPEPAGDDGHTIAEQAREWKIAVEQAENIAKFAGKLPAGVARSLEQSEAAGVDWRELLRRAWSETIPSDYSWMPLNRRHIWAGVYLPGVRCEGAGEIAIAVDCSGSVNARQLGLFETEIRSILEGQRPSQVHVLYFDTEVHKTEVYQAGQPIALTPVGGGGTNFAPCFRWLDERGIVPYVSKS